MHVELGPALRTKRAVAGDSNSLALSEFDEGLLCQVWVVLDLESRDGLLGVAEEVAEESAGEVAEQTTDLALNGHSSFQSQTNLTPISLARPSSTSSSIASQVSWIGVFSRGGIRWVSRFAS